MRKLQAGVIAAAGKSTGETVYSDFPTAFDEAKNKFQPSPRSSETSGYFASIQGQSWYCSKEELGKDGEEYTVLPAGHLEQGELEPVGAESGSIKAVGEDRVRP